MKPKQARTANKGDSRPITEVTGEFSARACDPPHPYMKNAPIAQKVCDQGRKTTVATQSALNRLTRMSAICSLSDGTRTSQFGAAKSPLDPSRHCRRNLSNAAMRVMQKLSLAVTG